MSSMISSKFTEIARNEIWRECIRKETKHSGADATFTANPSMLAAVTGKPGELAKALAEVDPATIEELKATLRKPAAKSGVPVTAAGDYGWGIEEAAAMNSDRHSRNKCTETKYSESYISMTGTTPYHRPGARK